MYWLMHYAVLIRIQYWTLFRSELFFFILHSLFSFFLTFFMRLLKLLFPSIKASGLEVKILGFHYYWSKKFFATVLLKKIPSLKYSRLSINRKSLTQNS